MTRGKRIPAVVTLALLILVAASGAHLVGRFRAPELDLSRGAIGALSQETRRFLGGLSGHLTFTCFLSSPDTLPSEMRHVERRLRTLLEAMRHQVEKEGTGTVDVHIIDPDLDPEHGAPYAARLGVAPLKVSSVVHDESSEQSIWASLVLAHDAHPEARIHAIRPADLPLLEGLIVAHLREMQTPCAWPKPRRHDDI